MLKGNNIKKCVKYFFDVVELKSAMSFGIVILFVGIVLVASYLGATFKSKVEPTLGDYSFAYAEDESSDEVAVSETEESKILVHIKGEVKSPGLYEVEDGCRVKDAIDLAGGVTENADVDGVNLAQKLGDEDEVYIPSIAQEKENKPKKTTSKKTATSKPVSTPKIININSASHDELTTLPGIGPAYAERILQYRQEVGEFRSIDEIMRIKGISRNIFDQIKEYIKV